MFAIALKTNEQSELTQNPNGILMHYMIISKLCSVMCIGSDTIGKNKNP